MFCYCVDFAGTSVHVLQRPQHLREGGEQLAMSFKFAVATIALKEIKKKKKKHTVALSPKQFPSAHIFYPAYNKYKVIYNKEQYK